MLKCEALDFEIDFHLCKPIEFDDVKKVLRKMQQKGKESRIKIPERQKKVLIAEDEMFIQNYYESIMKQQQIAALTANDGKEAVEIFRQSHQSIGLILLDKQMPQMDGFAACRSIRELEGKCIEVKVPIVLISGDEISQR